MARLPVVSFNSGLLSPKIHERTDVARYSSGCKVLDNFIPTQYGGVERRPGTVFLDNTGASLVRLIPFVYSAAIAYDIELSERRMRFFYDGVHLADSDIITPYSEAEIFSLHIRQIADVIRITHPNHKPRKLSRTGVETFELAEIDFRKGPFLTRNDLIDPDNPSTTTLACSVTEAGAYGTLSASSGVFRDGHVGALFKLIHKRKITSISKSGEGTSAELDVKGTARFVTTGSWMGKCILQRQDNGSDWTDYRTYEALTTGARNDSVTIDEDGDNVKYRIYAAPGMSAEFGATLNAHSPDWFGIVRILSVVNSRTAVVEVIKRLESTDATSRWAEGVWSEVRGWPSTITFFGDRCIYAGALSGVGIGAEEFANDYPSLRNLMF